VFPQDSFPTHIPRNMHARKHTYDCERSKSFGNYYSNRQSFFSAKSIVIKNSSHFIIFIRCVYKSLTVVAFIFAVVIDHSARRKLSACTGLGD